MGDAIKLHLELQSSLEKDLKQSGKAMSSFNSILEKSSKNFENINKNTDNINKSYKKLIDKQKLTNKLTNTFEKSLTKVKDVAKQALFPLTMLFTASNILETIKRVGDYNRQLVHLTHQMGESAKSAVYLQKTVYNVSIATGAATEKTMEMIVALKKYRVANKDIERMAKTMIYFSRVTGTSAETTKRLTGELMLTGKVSAKSTARMMADMAKVQNAVGLTVQDMESLSEGIITSTKFLHQMGKSAGDIEKFSSGLTKLAGGFATVGLSAKDATQLVDDLLNPDKIEQNALLYSKLGISMSDAISGNIDPGELQDKLKGLGKELKNMDNISANQLAKSMGMSLGMLRQMADMDTSKAGKAMLGTKDGTSELEKQKKEMMTMMEHITETFNKIKAWMEKGLFAFATNFKKLFKPALVIGLFLVAFKMLTKMRKKALSVGTDFSKSITTGIVGGMEMADKKSKTIAERVKGMGASYLTNRQQRVLSSSGYAKTNERADYFDEQSSRELLPSIQKMNKNTAQMLRNLSSMSKPTSYLDQLTANTNKKISDRLFMAKEEKIKVDEIYKVRMEEARADQNIIKERMNELFALKKEQGLSAEQTRELNKLYLQRKKINVDIEKMDKARVNSVENYKELEDKIIGKLGKDELANMYKKSKQQAEQLRLRQKEVKIELEELNVDKSIIQKEVEILQKKRQEGKLDAEGLITLRKRTSELSQINNEIAETEMRGDKINNQLEKELALTKKIESRTGKSGAQIIAEGNSTNKSLLGQTGDFFSSKLRDASTKISEGFVKFKESTKSFVENVKTRLSPKNLAAGIGKGLLKTTKAISGAGKAIAKAGVSFFIMGVVMKAIQPIMESLKPIMEDLVDKLMPPIFKILKALFPVFAILVNTLLPPLLRVAGYLLKALGGLAKSMMEMPIRIKYAIKPFMSKEDKEKGIATDLANMNKNNAVYSMFNNIGDAGSQLVELGKFYSQKENQLVDPHMLDNLEYKPSKRKSDATTPAGDSYAATLRATSTGIAVESAASPETAAKNTATNTATTANETKEVKENTSVMVKQLEEQKEINKQVLNAITTLTNKIENLGNRGAAYGSFYH